eukprot:2157753-Pyramimonas_sp.AAC.1
MLCKSGCASYVMQLMRPPQYGVRAVKCSFTGANDVMKSTSCNIGGAICMVQSVRLSFCYVFHA